MDNLTKKILIKNFLYRCKVQSFDPIKLTYMRLIILNFSLNAYIRHGYISIRPIK